MDGEPLSAKKIREHLKANLGQDKVDSKNGKSTIQNPKRFMRLLEMLVRELDRVSHKELHDRYQALYEETKEFLLREDR
jgi:threonine synthase